VVFNYPSGDTVVLERQNEDYYQIVRSKELELAARMGAKYQPGMGRKAIWNSYQVTDRPVDKRENYIKRCVAIPGDQIEIKNRDLYVNGELADKPENMQYMYDVYTTGAGLNKKVFDKLDITDGGRASQSHYVLALTEEKVKKLEVFSNVKSISPQIQTKGEVYPPIFPHDVEHFKWNQDNFGPLTIPKAGVTVNINAQNIALYKKIISKYEDNSLEIKGDKIFINGEEASEYTFKQDYYWLMGDNRHNSADSRYWGFVPEDHVVGKAVFVWLSLDPNKGLAEGKIRWNKIFRTIK